MKFVSWKAASAIKEMFDNAEMPEDQIDTLYASLEQVAKRKECTLQRLERKVGVTG